MDTLRGNLSGDFTPEDDATSYDRGEEENYRELPPEAIGQDERRMQVRAYNFWASLLTDRNLPSIEDLDTDNLPDFGPNSVLLDFSSGIDDPAIVFLGEKLAQECGSSGPITKLSDVPSRSLLSRITDHHLQIIANQAPIGFEAEFVNQSGTGVMYRGILLPFSSDDDTIDFIFGVINWKEIADQQTTDELLLEIDQALQAGPDPLRVAEPLTDWADGPQASAPPAAEAPGAGWHTADWPEPEELTAAAAPQPEAEPEAQPDAAAVEDLPAPSFGRRRRGLVADDPAPLPELEAEVAADFTQEPIAGYEPPPVPAGYQPDLAGNPGDGWSADHSDALDLSGFAEVDDYATPAPFDSSRDDLVLSDWLAAARDSVEAAHACEDRSRQSLYAAISRAYDFALAAEADPEGFAELLADAGLTVQERAPMTPLVKLVFGATYDKTRLTEYATVLGHARRLDLARGALEAWLAYAPGGLKGVVQAERQLRRHESGAPARDVRGPGERLLRKLRKLDTVPLGDVTAHGAEFTVLVARRLTSGEVVLLGEVADDPALLERAARRLVA